MLRLYNGGVKQELTYETYFTKDDDDGQTLLAGVVYYEGLEIVEILKTTLDGKLLHTLSITKIEPSSLPLDDTYFVVGLDTMLDAEDNAPVTADGQGGSYLSDGLISLWNEPISGLMQYVGDFWDDFDPDIYSPSAGNEKGTTLLDNADTAIIYKTPSFSYETIGDSHTFSWQERLYTDSIFPMFTGSVLITYIDTEGNMLSDSETLSGFSGVAYTTSEKEIPNYELVSVSDNASGKFTAEQQNVVYLYQIISTEPSTTESSTSEATTSESSSIEELSSEGSSASETTITNSTSNAQKKDVVAPINVTDLPKTGTDTPHKLLTFTGLVLSAIATLFLYNGLKRKQD